jgi:tight adherence protein B
MPPEFIIAFVVIFVGALAAAFAGLKFYEQRRRQQVTAVLKTIAGEAPSAPQTKILKDLPGENQSLIERILGYFNITGRAEAAIKQAGLEWTVERLFILTALGAGVVGLFAAMLVRTLPLTGRLLLGGCIGAALPYLSVMRKRSKRLAAFEEQLPEALDFLARSMRAGHAFSISLEMMSEEMPDPVGIEFRTLFNEQNLGAPLDLALKNLTERVPLLDARFFASAVLMQRQTGGNLSEILTRLAYVIRERFRLKGQVRAASAHGRMTAAILTAMPIVTMFALLVVAPGYLQGMAADEDGRRLIIGCIIAQVIGNVCIRKIIKIKV